MLNLTQFATKPKGLQLVIDQLEAHIKDIGPDHDDYQKSVDTLTKLYAMKKGDARVRVDPNAVIGAAASILGILLVLNYERLNIITSRAFSLVRTPKM